MEFKTITGTIRQIEEQYKEARKQAEIVFLKIDSAFSKDDVIKNWKGQYFKRAIKKAEF